MMFKFLKINIILFPDQIVIIREFKVKKRIKLKNFIFLIFFCILDISKHEVNSTFLDALISIVSFN